MDLEGRLEISVDWDGERLQDVAVQSSRPVLASRTFEGKPLDQVLPQVPMLFSICGRAQAAAIAGARDAAEGRVVAAEVGSLRELLVAAECAHEYLWRLLLDLPRLLGETSELERFAALRPVLTEPMLAVTRRPQWWDLALGRDGVDWTRFAERLRELLAAEIFGTGPEEWAQGGLSAVESWLGHAPTATARRAARLWREDFGASAVPRLPAGGAESLARAAAASLDSSGEFVARPTLNGVPHETGALARTGELPLVAAALAVRGGSAAVRLLARLAELAQLADRVRRLARGEPLTPWIRTVPLAPGRGAATVETARGCLLHYLALDDSQVGRYAIVAPTEWNFHPRGALAQGLAGVAAASATEAQRRAEIMVYALDPCVACRVEVRTPQAGGKA